MALLAVLTFNEVVTVNFLGFIRGDQCYPNIVIDHELGQLLTIYEHDLRIDFHHVVFGIAGKTRRGDKLPLFAR
jgi:hypothetical protein